MNTKMIPIKYKSGSVKLALGYVLGGHWAMELNWTLPQISQSGDRITFSDYAVVLLLSLMGLLP